VDEDVDRRTLGKSLVEHACRIAATRSAREQARVAGYQHDRHDCKD
jgi:hypothetical protein